MALTDAQTTGCYIRENPSGVAPITLAGTVYKGDILGYSSGWVQALATAASVVQGRCVALEGGISGDKIQACFGTCIIGGRISGATPGGLVYVAEGSSNGQYTETVPSTGSDATTIMGYIISATEIVVMPLGRTVSTA